jgi:hypothetical protein
MNQTRFIKQWLLFQNVNLETGVDWSFWGIFTREKVPPSLE